MKLISWNVNGLRAVLNKDFNEQLQRLQPDILCLQETKAQVDQVLDVLEHWQGQYHIYANSAERKGYSGVALLTRQAPLQVINGIGIEEHDREGRVLTAEYPGFYLVTVYTPNSGNELARLPYRQQWDQAFLAFVQQLEQRKPVVICGDLNVAHREIDIARPKANYNKSAGYTQAEIDGLDALTEAGFVDTFRTLHPDTVRYSWWSYRAGARQKNIGWRIDYFLASRALLDQGVRGAEILTEELGSDHCPVLLELDPTLATQP